VRRPETMRPIRGLLRGGDTQTERNGTNGQGNCRGTRIEACRSSRPHRGRRASSPPGRRPSPPPQEREIETQGRNGRPPHPLRRPFLCAAAMTAAPSGAEAARSFG